MIVVSDTSALTSLLQVGLERILPRLFEEVVIPEAVERELRRAHSVLPSFIRIILVTDRMLVDRLCRDLDQGEAEAIALILEKRGDLLLDLTGGDAFTDLRGGFAGLDAGDIGEFHWRHLDVEIDPIEQRTGDTVEVILDFPRPTTGFAGHFGVGSGVHCIFCTG